MAFLERYANLMSDPFLLMCIHSTTCQHHTFLLSRWLENKRPIIHVNWAQQNQVRWINPVWGLWLSQGEMELMFMQLWIRITGFYCIYTATTENKKHIKLGWILENHKNKRLIKSTFCNIPVGGTATAFIISECIWITLRKSNIWMHK